eukprot:scaffold7068_cov301-Pinguiococcus_pyrenoidosus.AAC.6
MAETDAWIAARRKAAFSSGSTRRSWTSCSFKDLSTAPLFRQSECISPPSCASPSSGCWRSTSGSSRKLRTPARRRRTVRSSKMAVAIGFAELTR